MKRLSPTQRLTLGFIAGLVLVVLVFRASLPHFHSLLLRYLMLGAILFVIKVASDRKARTAQILNDFSPLIFVVSLYESLGDLIHYLQPDIDSKLIKIDLFLFGVHPTVWMERWIVPWLTDAMSVAYGSYYFLPVILVVVLYLRKRTSEFEESVFVLTFGYYISFIGYIVFPAIGPRYSLAPLYSVPLEGSWITDFVRDTLNALEHNKRDCMPSGHTQIVLMVLYLARRYHRFLFWVFLPIVCALILSTVYLRYHYVIDLFAGVAFAAGSLFLAKKLYRYWTPQSLGHRS